MMDSETNIGHQHVVGDGDVSQLLTGENNLTKEGVAVAEGSGTTRSVGVQTEVITETSLADQTSWENLVVGDVGISSDDDDTEVEEDDTLVEPVPVPQTEDSSDILPFVGHLSPPSSQGSESSMEFCFQQCESIRNRQPETAEKLTALTPDKKTQKLVNTITGNHSFRERLQNFFKHEISSLLMSCPKLVNVDEQAKQKLLETLTGKEGLGVVGKALLEHHLNSGNDSESQSLTLAEPQADRNSENEATRGIDQLENLEQVVEIERPINAFPVIIQSQETKQNFSLDDNFLESAYFEMQKRDPKDRGAYLRGPGQSMFLKSFSKTEILECTFGGKDGTRKFDEVKVLYINKAISFFLSKPAQRTNEELAKHDSYLDSSDAYLLNKNVFKEYAYRQREKLKRSSPSGVKIEKEEGESTAKATKRTTPSDPSTSGVKIEEEEGEETVKRKKRKLTKRSPGEKRKKDDGDEGDKVEKKRKN